MVLGNLLMIVTTWLVHKKPLRVINLWSRRMQLVSAALYSLGHGGNDAQKTMGIIASLLFTSGHMKEFHIPLWIVLSAHSAIALGTMTGGWRIVKTMGQKIVKLRPIDGFCAETASAISIFLATHAGIPVSTTHVITGAVTGVGAVKNAHAVKWQVTLKIVWAWVFTIPAAALCAAWSTRSLGSFNVIGDTIPISELSDFPLEISSFQEIRKLVLCPYSGASSSRTRSLEKRAASAPSTTRWSKDRQSGRIVLTSTAPFVDPRPARRSSWSPGWRSPDS